MRADEATAMARVFSDAPMEDVYEIIAIALNVLDERGEDVVMEGTESDGEQDHAAIGSDFKVAYDPVLEKWRVRAL